MTLEQAYKDYVNFDQSYATDEGWSLGEFDQHNNQLTIKAVADGHARGQINYDFVSSNDANNFVFIKAYKGSEYHKKALGILQALNPDQYQNRLDSFKSHLLKKFNLNFGIKALEEGWNVFQWPNLHDGYDYSIDPLKKDHESQDGAFENSKDLWVHILEQALKHSPMHQYALNVIQILNPAQYETMTASYQEYQSFAKFAQEVVSDLEHAIGQAKKENISPYFDGQYDELEGWIKQVQSAPLYKARELVASGAEYISGFEAHLDNNGIVNHKLSDWWTTADNLIESLEEKDKSSMAMR